MKRILLLLAILATFTFAAVGQDASQAGGAHGTTTDSATKKTSKKAGPDEPSKSGHVVGTTGNDKMSRGKGSTLTGCVSSSANSEGMYTLSNGRYKNGVEIGPVDKVKDHAGHQVALTGKWGTGAEAGETSTASAKEKGERHFQVDSVKHISETCSTASGAGMTGSKMKGDKDKKSSSSATPPQTK
jgi:hypothetical protein